MNSIRIIVYVFVLFLSYIPKNFATHIVGGEISYTCIGENQYLLEFTIFRDCQNGDSNALFDNVADFGVYNQITNERVLLIEIPLNPMLDDTLSPILNSQCFVDPPSVCVHTTTYSQFVTLPYTPEGFIIGYQRCCRNGTINNIVEPLETGATFFTEITGEGLLQCNSSPKFSTWPPIYICAAEPIFFDQSAFDSDGDSLVYKLCTPLHGAELNNPNPTPEALPPPPFDEIVWEEGYGIHDMLNGSDGTITPLNIDINTGFLTGTPIFEGQFVVGLCVEEYRDGVLMGRIQRDFQYNVGICGNPTSSASYSEVLCNETGGTFYNESEFSNEFLWIFDIGGQEVSHNNIDTIFYDFETPGEYLTWLIVEPNTNCADTSFLITSILEDNLIADFEVITGDCQDELYIDLINQSSSSSSQIQQFHWTYIINEDTITSTTLKPSLIETTSGEATIILTVTTEFGCIATSIQNFTVDLIDIDLEMTPLIGCIGDTVFLNPNFQDNDYNFDWDSNIVNDNTSPNPFIIIDNATESINVEVSNTSNTCSKIFTVTVNSYPIPDIQIQNPITTCDAIINLTPSLTNIDSLFWYNDANFNSAIDTIDILPYTAMGLDTIYLLGKSSQGCITQTSTIINGQGTLIQIPQTIFLCPGDPITVAPNVSFPAESLSYQWSPEDFLISNSTDSLLELNLNTSGIFNYTLQTTNSFSCTTSDTVQIVIGDSLLIAAINNRQCLGHTIDFESNDILAPFYHWDFGDPNSNTDQAYGSAISYNYPQQGDYEVTISIDQLTCTEPYTFIVQVTEPNLFIDFDQEIISCEDSLQVMYINQSESIDDDNILSFQWSNQQNLTSNQDTFVVSYTQNTEDIVQLVIETENGCQDTITNEFVYPLNPPQWTDTLQACQGQYINLFPQAPTSDHTFLWSENVGSNQITTPNPIIQSLEPQQYNLTLSDTTSEDYECTYHLTVDLLPFPHTEFAILGDTSSCETTFAMQTSPQGTIADWSLTPDFSEFYDTDNETTFTLFENTTVFAQYIDSNECVYIDSQQLVIHAIQLPPITQSICHGDTITLALGMQNDTLTYNWLPDQDILNIDDQNNAIVAPTSDQSYNFQATNQYECQADGTYQVEVFQPMSSFPISATSDSIFIGQSTELSTIESPNHQYTWQAHHSLDNTSGVMVTATPTQTTTYYLTIENSEECPITSSYTIYVIPFDCKQPQLYIPNTFSPNHDNINDTFLVHGTHLNRWDMLVYNRWGQLVFEEKNSNKGWDGTFQNRELPPDVYAYIVTINCPDESTKILKGNITLLR